MPKACGPCRYGNRAAHRKWRDGSVHVTYTTGDSMRHKRMRCDGRIRVVTIRIVLAAASAALQ